VKPVKVEVGKVGKVRRKEFAKLGLIDDPSRLEVRAVSQGPDTCALVLIFLFSIPLF
jgi:hypothetical protein